MNDNDDDDDDSVHLSMAKTYNISSYAVTLLGRDLGNAPCLSRNLGKSSI
jgi:hypothetical protein